jgi:hypothetical protein
LKEKKRKGRKRKEGEEKIYAQRLKKALSF